jgi:hypothetical protein
LSARKKEKKERKEKNREKDSVYGDKLGTLWDERPALFGRLRGWEVSARRDMQVLRRVAPQDEKQ